MNTDKITDELITNIRKSVDIVDIISSYIPLTSRGRNYLCFCPFHLHNHRTESMSISKEKQIYKCFSCGATGNVFNFVMEMDNISFIEALKKVAKKAGIELKIASSTKQGEKNQDLYDMYDLSKKVYQNNINSEYGIEAKKYLMNRAINEDILKEFEIGLSLKDNKILTNLFKNKKYSENQMIESGLITNSNTGLHDIYYDRIMFPLYDLSGNVVGYSGRIYNKEDSSKYINTKQTRIFKKGELLYNYHRAKDEARMQGKIIVMEGFMDVIASYKIGIKNVVATMGTAVTKIQANLMKKLSNEIIICMDGDSAGAHGTYTCIDELTKLGVIPKVVRLEDNLDPDEYITRFGKEKFINKLEHPISIIDFKLDYLKTNKNLEDNVEYSNYLNESLKEIQKIDDELLVELTLQKLSKESNIDIDLLRSKLEKKGKKIVENDYVNPKQIENKKSFNKYQKAEKYLMYYMLNSSEVVDIFNEQKIFLPTEKYRLLSHEICSIYKKTKEINIADIIAIIDEQYKNTIDELLNMNIKDDYTKEEIIDYIKVIKISNIKDEKTKLKNLMKKESVPIKKIEIAEKIKKLKEMELEIMKEG